MPCQTIHPTVFRTSILFTPDSSIYWVYTSLGKSCPIFSICTCPSKLRWLQATKSIISGTNTQALTAKADLLKEEMDEAMNKVELCKVSSMHEDASHVFIWKLLVCYGFVSEGSSRSYHQSFPVRDTLQPGQGERRKIRTYQDLWTLCPSFLMHTDDLKCPVSLVCVCVYWTDSLVNFSV